MDNAGGHGSEGEAGPSQERQHTDKLFGFYFGYTSFCHQAKVQDLIVVHFTYDKLFIL